MRPRIAMVGADKGGVGKTTISRALLEYTTLKGITPRIVDTEPAPGVLKRFYPGAELIDVRSVAGQMKVIDDPRPLTVLDVRAGLLSPSLRSLRDAGLFNDARSGQLEFLILHIIGPTYASYSEIQTVEDLITPAETGARHVLVQNYISEDQIYDWKSDLPTLKIPHLDNIAVEAMDEEGVRYEDFARDAKSRMLRGTVRHWLGQVYDQFNAVWID